MNCVNIRMYGADIKKKLLISCYLLRAEIYFRHDNKNIGVLSCLQDTWC